MLRFLRWWHDIRNPMKHELRAPTNLSPVARACLERLAEHGELISLGGAIGLAY